MQQLGIPQRKSRTLLHCFAQRNEMEHMPIFHGSNSQGFNLDFSQCYQINAPGVDRLPVLLLTRRHYKKTTAHFPSLSHAWCAPSVTLPSAILALLPSPSSLEGLTAFRFALWMYRKLSELRPDS